VSIRQWPQDDRPREKLLTKGPGARTNAELLAIFLRVGCRGMDAKSMAQSLLDQFGGLSPLLTAGKTDFCLRKGLGEAKYCQLQASLELTKRYLSERLTSSDVFSSPDEVMDYLAIQMRDYHREVFVMLSLDTKHRLIDFTELFQGTINSASVYPR
jgi:DNA repair protein RadC